MSGRSFGSGCGCGPCVRSAARGTLSQRIGLVVKYKAGRGSAKPGDNLGKVWTLGRKERSSKGRRSRTSYLHLASLAWYLGTRLLVSSGALRRIRMS